MPSATRLMLERDTRGPWRRRPRNGFRLGYRPALEGLRGLAIAAVVGFDLLIPHFEAGHVGIDVFFVLSGFLITSLLLEEWERQGRIDLTSFYIRRAVRILPPLLLVLFVCLFAGFVFSSGEDASRMVRGAVAALLYLGNWALAQGQDTGTLGHTWTLAVQEQFYLVWPPVLVWLLKRIDGHGRLALLILLACGAVAAIRYGLFAHFGWQHAYYDVEARGDAMLMGCTVACLAAGGMLPTRGWRLTVLRVLGLIALGGLVAVPLADADHYRLLYLGLYSAVELAAATLIASLVSTPTGPLQNLLSFQPFVWLGRLSYGIYLWHYPVATVVGGNLDNNEAWAGTIALTLLLAAVTHFFVERPLLGLREALRRVPGERTSATQTLVLQPPALREPDPEEAPHVAGVQPWIHEPFVLPPAKGSPTATTTPSITSPRSSGGTGITSLQRWFSQNETPRSPEAL